MDDHSKGRKGNSVNWVHHNRFFSTNTNTNTDSNTNTNRNANTNKYTNTNTIKTEKN